MNVRNAERRDLPHILAVELACDSASHWPEATYRQMLQPDSGRVLLVAEQRGIIGFLASRTIRLEWEIENIAVDPSRQREGVGSSLVRKLLAWAREQGATEISLEVRVSNSAARALYLSCGFAEVGRRKGYYCSPQEDAVLLRRKP